MTAVQKVGELREELAAQGVVLAFARAKSSLARFFTGGWFDQLRESNTAHNFTTVRAAVIAFRKRHKAAERASGSGPSDQG